MKKYYSRSKFIEHANAVHSEKYDYSLVKFRGASTKVKIGCSKHGIFEQTPSQHLSGKVCPYCSSNRLMREEFLLAVKELYGERYDYSKCTYTHITNLTEYLTVTCNNHGDFHQKADNLLRGIGCPRCKREENRRDRLIERITSVQKEKEPLGGTIDSKTYLVILRYKTAEAGSYVYIWTEPFPELTNANRFVEDIKMFLDMSDSMMVEEHIIEKYQQFLDRQQTLKLIKWLCLDSNEVYTHWWDVSMPSYLPRDLKTIFPDYEQFFAGSEIESIISFISRLHTEDLNTRISA